MPITIYRDDQREYLEVAVSQANLHQVNRHQRIAEAIRRVIPYPLLLVLACESRVAINEKRTIGSRWLEIGRTADTISNKVWSG